MREEAGGNRLTCIVGEMEKQEPSFVPEWLKAATGNSSSSPISYPSESHSRKDESGGPVLLRFRSQLFPIGNGLELDHAGYPSTSDRVYQPRPRRLIRSGSLKDYLSAGGRESLSRSRYTSNLADDCLNSASECHRDQDWEHLLERDSDPAVESWRHPSLSLGRYTSVSSSKILENGALQYQIEAGTLAKAPSLANGVSENAVKDVEKSVFDRNFPSLGAQDKPTVALQSSLGDVSVLNGRSNWQASYTKEDRGRVSPTSMNACLDLRANMTTTDESRTFQSGNGSLASKSLTSSFPALASTTGASLFNSQRGPKLADAALLQNVPTRVRTPPQELMESQRSEELTLKQLRQLVPIKPSLPKTLGQSSSLREKSKSKNGWTLDVSGSKSTEGKVPSQPLSPLCRSLPLNRQDTTGKLQSGGRLLVQKHSQEAVAAVNTGSAVKLNGSHPSTVSISSTILSSGLSSATNFGTVSLQRQLVDRKALLSSFPHTRNSVASKEVGFVSDDKRQSLQAQNRSAFFKALRQKAALGSVGISDGFDTLPNQLEQESCKVPKKSVEQEPGLDMHIDYSERDEGVSDNASSKDLTLDSPSAINVGEKEDSSVANGIVVGVGVDNANNLTVQSENPAQIKGLSIAGGSEEEEAAFLKSLGWVEDSREEEEEALTEEEISSFLKEHMSAVASRFLCYNSGVRLKNFAAVLRTGKDGFHMPAINAVDLESGEPRAQRC